MNRDELLRLLQEAVGEASMCWSRVEDAGVFDSERALAIAKRLADQIPLQSPPDEQHVDLMDAQDHT